MIVMATIEYEAPDGVEKVEREEWHTDVPNMITGYDTKDSTTNRQTVSIPINRVIRVYGATGGYSPL